MYNSIASYGSSSLWRCARSSKQIAPTTLQLLNTCNLFKGASYLQCGPIDLEGSRVFSLPLVSRIKLFFCIKHPFAFKKCITKVWNSLINFPLAGNRLDMFKNEKEGQFFFFENRWFLYPTLCILMRWKKISTWKIKKYHLVIIFYPKLVIFPQTCRIWGNWLVKG